MTDIWGKLLLALAGPLLAVFIGAIKSIINNAPSPTRRRYWADELPARIELASSDGIESRLRGKLSRRAEVALEYLDADEAIRRARVTGPTPVWSLAISSYVLGLGINLQINLGNWHPIFFILAICFIGLGVWAQIVAVQIPDRRRELLRVLVEVQGLHGGYDALLRSPEEIVGLWTRYRKRIRKLVHKRCTRQAKVVTYAKFAEELIAINAVNGRIISMKSKKPSILSLA